MNCTIDRAALLTAAKHAAQIAPAASPLDILKCALLEIDTGQRCIYIAATDLEISLRQSVPLLAHDGGSVTLAVNARLLAAMLTRMAEKAVELHAEEQQLSLSGGDALYRMPAASAKSYPAISDTVPEKIASLTGITSLVRRTAFATDQSGTMPLSRCVYLRLTDRGLCAAGSDGVCIVSVQGDTACIGSSAFLVPALSLEKLAQLCTDKDSLSIGTANRQIVFAKEGFQFRARLMEGRYIEVDRLIAEAQSSFTVLTDGTELRRVLQTVSAACNDDRLTLCFEGDRLTFRCSGELGASAASLPVIPLTGQPAGECCFALDRLKKCLRALRGTATLGVARTGMLTLAAEDAFYMQTQLRAAAKAKPTRRKTAKAA